VRLLFRASLRGSNDVCKPLWVGENVLVIHPERYILGLGIKCNKSKANMENVAHVKRKENGEWDEPQGFEEQLLGTAEMAALLEEYIESDKPTRAIRLSLLLGYASNMK
jgi:hypothetical protein